MLNAGVRSPFLGRSAQDVHANPKGGMAMKRRGIIALSRLRRAFWYQASGTAAIFAGVITAVSIRNLL